MAFVHKHGSEFHVCDRNYRAAGDGVTDDTAAIQAAIDDASDWVETHDTGADVVIPYGKYLITETLTIAQHMVCLRGSGAGGDDWRPTGTHFVLPDDFANDTYVVNYDWTDLNSSLHGNCMEGIRIAALENQTFDNTTHGVKWGVFKGSMVNCKIQGMSGRALGIQGKSASFKAYDNQFVRCSYRLNGTHGIEMLGSESDNWFGKCKSEGNTSGAGLYGLGANSYYEDCHFTGNKNNIVNTNGSTESVFTGCNFETPEEHNVLFTTTNGAISRFRLIGCQFDSNRLSAGNTFDAVFIGNDSGSFTASGCIIGCTFAGSDTNKPRYHINLSDAAAFQVLVLNPQPGSTSYGTAYINHSSSAVRCIVHGMGINNGDPNSAGNWQNNGIPGVDVHDTANSKIYKAVSPTSFLVLN